MSRNVKTKTWILSEMNFILEKLRDRIEGSVYRFANVYYIFVSDYKFKSN